MSSAIVVAMIIEIVKEMIWFLLIVVLAVAGFGNTYLIILRNEVVEPGERHFIQTEGLSWA